MCPWKFVCLQKLKKPSASHFLLAAAGVPDGSANSGENIVGTISLKHVYEIAKVCLGNELDVPRHVHVEWQ
jgi:ribosomal protein L11